MASRAILSLFEGCFSGVLTGFGLRPSQVPVLWLTGGYPVLSLCCLPGACFCAILSHLAARLPARRTPEQTRLVGSLWRVKLVPCL